MKNLINKSVSFIICSLILIKNVNAANDIDANWMTYIPDSKYLYEINIPGTHDSGTYDIGQFSNSKILNKIASRSGLNAINAAKSEFGRTQDLDIKEQLEHGIRYLDIRISTTDNEENIFYLSHGNNLPVIDTVSCIDLNSKNDEGYGIHLRIGGMGGCRDYPDDGKVCYPIYYNTSNANIKYVIQDAYNLDGPDKWDLVKNTITKFVSFRDEKENIIKGSKYTDLTLNFMNMARMEFNKDSFEGVVNSAGDFFFDSGIEESANYVNTELTNYILDTKYSINLIPESSDYIINNNNNPVYHNWFILDFPSNDVIRSIYQSNNFNDPNLNKNKVEVSGWEEFYADSKYYISQIPISGRWAETVIDIADTVIGWFSKKDEKSNNKRSCLQRHSNTDKVSVLSKCVKNSKNQWYINSNGKYYNIISAYDNKCLSYNKSQNTLEISKCDKSNHNIDFTVKDRIICSRVDENKCLNGKFDLLYVTLQSKKYDNLSCSSRFAKYGYPCCSDQTIPTQYVDNIGNWGIENGKLCGLGYERCSFEALGYHCCSNANPKVAILIKTVCGDSKMENGVVLVKLPLIQEFVLRTEKLKNVL
eukprot:jgi/Orpsp1_1/1176303/evm.model.c7180000057129.2